MDSPLNSFTGQVSAIAILDMIQRGQTTFPRNMGEISAPQTSPLQPPMTRADWLRLREAAQQSGNIILFNEANAALGL